MFKKNLAFTLAETLVVIAIIGVVAALSLPNLNSATGDKEKITRVKKVYQNLNEALDRAEVVYGPFDSWFIDLIDSDSEIRWAMTTRTGERLSKFIKVSKTCGLEFNKGCFSKENVKQFDGTDSEMTIEHTKWYKMILSSGESIYIRSNLYAEKVDPRNPKMEIAVDIDGPNKGPNRRGFDLLSFELSTSDKGEARVFAISSGLSIEEMYNELMEEFSEGYAASEWILRYENVDYIQFIENEGKCKNGTMPTEEHPSCN